LLTCTETLFCCADTPCTDTRTLSAKAHTCLTKLSTTGTVHLGFRRQTSGGRTKPGTHLTIQIRLTLRHTL
jgi:hypothetical protein